MKNKRNLKNNRLYQNVYIENDLPYETRNIQAAVRTVLKEISSQKSKFFITSLFFRESGVLSLSFDTTTVFSKVSSFDCNC
jgi:hypothetical protein